ncbi:hypothetical protein BC829DRAFT_395322 [Chytridium lagenaria]|nr:hypothetical protein BC829DRAFT_395322 [Chytridium lagenaria]
MATVIPAAVLPSFANGGAQSPGRQSPQMRNVNATHINPLANPKGRKHNCELCGKPAYIQCKDCRVTFYCDKEHQLTDFRGIHNKICNLLVPLRTPVAVQLLELSKTEAHKKLFEGQFDLAIPAALQALRFSMDVYGQNSIELVPSLPISAKWAVLKSEKCENSVRAHLHKNFGLLYASQGSYEEALKQLAQDIYYSSLDHGPDHIAASGGYFQLANVFHRQGKTDQVVAVFDKVVSIWKTSLKSADIQLNEAQQAEAIQMLNAIFAFRQSFSGSSTSSAEINYVLGQLHFATGNYEKAKEYSSKALEIYESALGREHSLTIEAKQFFKSVVGERQTTRGASSVARRASVIA